MGVIFEEIGLLIGIEDIPQEKKAGYLSSLLIRLCNQVQELLLNANIQNQEEPYAKIAHIQKLIMAINTLSKTRFACFGGFGLLKMTEQLGNVFIRPRRTWILRMRRKSKMMSVSTFILQCEQILTVK
ncbi:hypothetical protein MKW98_031565 [Papaver atlanticum]|uniref:Uncharacterized protein n=1 Tax=Papaver atlanticum TaxID=357466 RepID=A0AAD4S628_9MAGN|nr:hypothetical protein MKW98_031565 [Papaver atlanticum]